MIITTLQISQAYRTLTGGIQKIRGNREVYKLNIIRMLRIFNYENCMLNLLQATQNPLPRTKIKHFMHPILVIQHIVIS